MIPNTQSKFFISKVSYFDESKRICTEFSNSSKKLTKCFAFFPSLFLHPTDCVDFESFSQKLSSFSSNSFKLFQEKDAVKIVANKYSTLEELHSFLEKEFQQEILLLSPERQFLILNNLSYFDSFQLQEDEFIPLKDFSFPEIITEFSSEPLTETFSQLMDFDKPSAKKFLNTLIYSNLLKLPFTETPLNQNEQFNCFLENLFFKNSLTPNSDSEKTLSFRKPFRKNFYDAIELDFSNVFSQVLLQKNLCFSSLNCSCCKPTNPFSQNALPSSLVKVRFLEEAFYFDSQFKWFSEKFHLTHEHKGARVSRRKEFFLNSFPVGPFFSGGTEFIPLADALILRENNSLELLQESKLHWTCNKKKSFLAESLSELLQNKSNIQNSLNATEKNLMQEHNLQAFSLLEEDFDYQFRKQYSKNLLELFNYSSHYLTNASNKYFSATLSESLLSLKAVVLNKLQDFLKEKEARYLHEEDSKVFLQNLESFNLNEFAETQKIPIFRGK